MLKKHHADAEFPGQCNSVSVSSFAEESFRNFQQQTGAIAAAAVGIHAAAMGQADQSAESSFHHGMRRGAAELGNEAHAACVMVGRKCRATFPHITCLTGNAIEVQSSIFMRRMDFSAPPKSDFQRLRRMVLYGGESNKVYK
jgi:hypothetical protein